MSDLEKVALTLTKNPINTTLLPAETIDKLYTNLSYILKGNKLSTLNVVLISIDLMQIVETYPGLSGYKKKQLIKHVLVKFTNDTLAGDDRIGVLLFINTFLDDVIESIIAIDKKQIIIELKKKTKGFFSCCK